MCGGTFGWHGVSTFIRLRNEPMLKINWFRAGIMVADVYSIPDDRFYSYPELLNITGAQLSFLDYYTLLANIPGHWKDLLQTDQQGFTKQSLEEKVASSSEIYWSLIKKSKLKIRADKSRDMWARDIGMEITDDQWHDHYLSLGKITKSVKLRYFQFRLSHRKLMTTLLRSKWDQKIDPTCTFCHRDLETVWHVLYNWECVKVIWNLLIKWLEYMLDVRIVINDRIVLCNTYQGAYKELINTVFLITKQYIYAQKCLHNQLNIMHLMQRLYEMKNLEHIVAVRWGVIPYVVAFL